MSRAGPNEVSSVEQRLRAVLEHARAHTAHYASILPAGDAPIPQDVIALLGTLPTMTRQDLRRLGPRIQARDGDSTGWRIIRSSGTTGEPVDVILDASARAAENAALARHLDRCIGADWRGSELIHLVLHGGAASRAVPSPWSAGQCVVKWNLLRAWNAGDECFGQAIGHTGGKVVTTLPSVAELIAGRTIRSGIAGHVRPRLLVLSGEAVDAEIREAAAHAFGCPVTSLYTVAEAGIVGAECTTDGGYHVQADSVFVEILDAESRPAALGEPGEIVLTPLINLAMPLLRYRTGDGARWATGPCGCGDAAPRLLLAGGRRPSRLITSSGAAINVIRFAKLLGSLEIDRFQIGQAAGGEVVVSYQAARPLDAASTSVAAAAVRAALGPSATVLVRRDAALLATADSGQAARGQGLDEPQGPELTDVARWLRDALAGQTGLQAALITGSALDREMATRFSDIDLVLLVNDDADERWAALALRLRRILLALSVNIAQPNRLPQLAPLLTCRLLSEQLPLIGRVDESLLARPNCADLRAEGRHWANSMAASTWLQETDPFPRAVDPVREAWHLSKLALQALRYRYLSAGHLDTSARAVLLQLRADPEAAELQADILVEAFDVAREIRPPPVAGVVPRYRRATAACLRWVALSLCMG